MADLADKANDLQELELQNILKKQSNIPKIPFSGSCLSCDEPLSQARYCDSYCRENHEKKLRR